MSYLASDQIKSEKALPTIEARIVALTESLKALNAAFWLGAH